MKMLLGAVLVAAAFFAGAANAADGTKLTAACKAAVENKTLPPNISADTYLKFCACLITKAGDNQSVIDEHVAILTAGAGEMQAKIEASSPAAKANAASCQNETGIDRATRAQ